MTTNLHIPSGCTTRSVIAPAMPGPFINANLLPVGADDHGLERFWISTFNTNAGAVGVLADENGAMTVHRFGLPHIGFYSAAVEDAHTLWLCGDLSRFVRLHLDTGTVDCFPTEAITSTTTFAGMVFDSPTRQLFCGGILRWGASFDIETKKAVIFKDQWPSRRIDYSFPNGDGTWTLIGYFPTALMRWDPRTNAVSAASVPIAGVPVRMLNRLVHDERWGWYLPTLGWYDTANDRLLPDGPRPQRETMWFARRGQQVFGAERRGSDMQVYAWELDTGHVAEWASIPDMAEHNVCMSRRGDIVAMSVDGVFRIYDGEDSGLKLVRPAPAAARSIGAVDCLRLIDRDRLLGTTFITQRFWEADLASGQSRDCGRAAPGVGEVMQTCRIGRHIYMAAYTGGELVEYDPNEPIAFPTNPRVVAHHPLAMRPVAIASHGPILWYACSRKYGTLGSILFRYDTRSGRASWAVNPLGPRQITSLMVNSDAGELICGSTIHADMGSADPAVQDSMVARLDMDDLDVRLTRSLPQPRIDVLGWAGDGELLCMKVSEQASPCLVDAGNLEEVEGGSLSAMERAAGHLPVPVLYTGRVGQFVAQIDDRVELHDIRRQESLVHLLIEGVERNFHPFDWQLDDDSLLLRRPGGEVVVMHDLLKDFPSGQD